MLSSSFIEVPSMLPSEDIANGTVESDVLLVGHKNNLLPVLNEIALTLLPPKKPGFDVSVPKKIP